MSPYILVRDLVVLRWRDGDSTPSIAQSSGRQLVARGPLVVREVRKAGARWSRARVEKVPASLSSSTDGGCATKTRGLSMENGAREAHHGGSVRRRDGSVMSCSLRLEVKPRTHLFASGNR